MNKKERKIYRIVLCVILAGSLFTGSWLPVPASEPDTGAAGYSDIVSPDISMQTAGEDVPVEAPEGAVTDMGGGVPETQEISGEDIPGLQQISGEDIPGSQEISGEDMPGSQWISGEDISGTQEISGEDIPGSQRISGEDIPDSQEVSGEDIPETQQDPEEGITETGQSTDEDENSAEQERDPKTQETEGSAEEADEEELTEEEEDLVEQTMSGEEVAGAIHEIIEASSQLVLADMDGIERLQDYIDETQEAYGKLSEKEQAVLTGSMEYLGHAAAAVDVMQDSMEQMEKTGTVIIEQSAKENSWRYIDGVPVRQALEVVEEETIEVAEAVPDENLLTSGKTPEKKTPQGELLSMTMPAVEKPKVVLVGNDSVKEGIDVSEWQGVIDWQQVKNSGISFAIIRCGYGNDFVSQDDDMWLYNVQSCEQYGIPYGVYLYSHATTANMIDSEVAHTLRLLEGHNPQLPVYLDIEENSQVLLGDAKLSKLADRYCSRIMQAGYKAGIYAGTYGWERFLTLVAKNNNYFHWVAQWNPKGCSYGGRYEMWQYAVEPGVPGISGDVDRDVWYGALPKANAKIPVSSQAAAKKTRVSYKSHVQSFGWEGSWIRDGALSGTEGRAKRLEGIQIRIENNTDLGVEYKTHVQTYGWEDAWRADGATSGTTGESKRLEAIRIRLTGKDAEKYDIYYCVHAQHFGWLNWAKNGDPAGTAGYGYRLEGIRIRLVKKGDAAPASMGTGSASFRQARVRYNAHVQTFGWQDYQSDGDLAGTTGLSKRLEGIHIQLTDRPYSGDIEYRTHIQTYGWEKNWKKNGEMSGTTGQAKRLEAIRIRLTGEMAEKYDVWYQTHVQHFGWTGWAKNGDPCGSAGYAYRMEGIRIRLTDKGSSAPGSTKNTFYQR